MEYLKRNEEVKGDEFGKEGNNGEEKMEVDWK